MIFKNGLLILLTFGFQLVFTAPRNSNEGPSSIQEFCESYAKRMKSYMNTSVDPCVDFYEFACGNYPNMIEDIELTNKQNGLYDLTHSMDKIIDQILQKERQPNEEYYEELQKVKQYVEVCDKADILPLNPSEEYLKVLKDIGGFPAVDPSWNASEFDWFNMTAHLVRYGVVGLLKEEIFMRHPFPPSYEIARFGFGFDVYSENIKTDESLGYVHNVQMMKRILEVYGVVGSKADEVIGEIIDFWREYLPVQNGAKDDCSALEEGEDVTFSRWNSLFLITMNATNETVSRSIPCPCDFYFNQFDSMTERSSRALANYMALKFLYEMHPKVKSAKYQHQHCVTEVKLAMPMLFTHFLIKEHFSNEVRQEVEEIIKQNVKSFESLVESNQWIDEYTRTGVLDLLKILKTNIGRVEDPITDTYNKEIKRLNFTNNYALNSLEVAKFKVDISYYIFKHSDAIQKAVGYHILEAILPNAFYDISDHTISVLAGILYPPIYHSDLPKSIQYGTLGFIIGHELVHSIDPRGRMYEEHFRMIHFWTKESDAAMKKNSQCYIDHHNNVTVPELNIKLNGKASLTETVCDSGGLRGSLDSFRRVSNGTAESMPGLDLSPDQSFFLGFAQIYCAKYEPRHYWSELYAGYPMDKYRVMLPLQNFDEFSKVFECPVGSPMNPEKKCRMW